jgi:hypothetical protein
MWRVTAWQTSDDGRWSIAAVSDHPNGDWQSALAVARAWFAASVEEIEAHTKRIKINPVNPP